MTREVKYKDENCYHEAVIAYRDQFSLMPNRGFRQDIAVTIKTFEDLCIWQDLLAHWGYMKDGKWHKRSPLDIKGLLTCFEAKVRENERKRMEQNNGHNETASISTRSGKGLPKGGDSDVPEVPRQPPSLYFRTR